MILNNEEQDILVELLENKIKEKSRTLELCSDLVFSRRVVNIKDDIAKLKNLLSKVKSA